MVKVEKSSAKPGEIKLDKKWTLNSFFFGGGGVFFFVVRKVRDSVA